MVLSCLNFAVTDTVKATWYNDEWANFRVITINSSCISENLINYPMTINISDYIGDWFNANTSDVRFMSTDNITVYDCEKERIADGSDRIFHVEIPYVYADVDTTFLMYYNNTNATPLFDTEGVWDSDFRNVQHFNETTGTHYDSTNNDNDSIFIDVSTQGSATGVIDGCDAFIASSDDSVQFLTITPPAYSYSIELWLKSDVMDSNDIAWGKAGEGSIIIYADGKIYFDDGLVAVDDYSFIASSWFYVVVTHSQNELNLYVNGGLSEIDVGISNNPLDYDYYIGQRMGTNSNYWDGQIDEFRISSVKRNASYVNATYRNVVYPLSFFTVGNEVSPNIAPVLTGEYPVNTSSNIEPLSRLNVTCNDANGGLLTAVWLSNSSGAWVQFGSNVSFSANSNISQMNVNFTEYNTTYYWCVNLTDGAEFVNNTYWFSTELTPPYYSRAEIDAMLDEYYNQTESEDTFLSAVLEFDYTAIMFILWLFLIVLGEWKEDWAYKILQLPIGLTYGVTLLGSDLYMGLSMIFASIYILSIAYWQSRKGEKGE